MRRHCALFAYRTLCLLGFFALTLPSGAQTTAPNQWTWIGGTAPTQAGGQPGVYGTLGTPASANTPGSRGSSVTWTDANDNMWLFGGYNGYYLNDLWVFNLTVKQWAWMGGSSSASVLG